MKKPLKKTKNKILKSRKIAHSLVLDKPKFEALLGQKQKPASTLQELIDKDVIKPYDWVFLFQDVIDIAFAVARGFYVAAQQHPYPHSSKASDKGLEYARQIIEEAFTTKSNIS